LSALSKFARKHFAKTVNRNTSFEFYQIKKHLLFVYSELQMRSQPAEGIFADYPVPEVDAAGEGLVVGK
jgi:hypothetical protein